MMSYYARATLDQLPAGERERLLSTHSPLGFHPDSGDELLLEDRDRYAGMYVIGVQGVGKSGLLENLIRHDAEVGNAVIVIDPHGDLTNHCLAALPHYRLSDTYLLDMEDEAYPFGANVFNAGKLDTSIKQAQAVERIMHIFEVLWADVLSQQHLPRYVRAATIAFLDNPGATLVDMHTFLLDPDVRHRMLQNVSDPTVRLFWQSQYDNLSAVEQTRRIQPLINRLEALFMGRSLIRNIVGQRRTTINFRRAIEERQIVFVKLPVKQVAQDARLVGTILLAQLYAAVFSFADIPEAQRPGVSLYVDEFQHFATPDFASLFTEGRKFGVRLTLAHQYRDQLPQFLQQSTVTARTKICFRVTPGDATEMAKEFPQPEGELEISHRPTKELLNTSAECPPAVREFVETYLRNLPKGGEVEIKQAMGVGDYLLRDGKKPLPIHKPNPLGALDHLLYEVMLSQNPTLPIPGEAIYGLANGGMGFLGAINIFNGGILQKDIYDFPAHLVRHTHSGLAWVRRPESAKEQLMHCIFHLRMTMHYLAEHPVGKQKSSSGNVAAMLTQLPARAAFVKSDKIVGAIYTHDTPRKLTGDDLQRRMFSIREQTRATYCHPRAEVEKPHEIVVHTTLEGEIPLRRPMPSKPVTRWEDDDV
jgi:hypothetical protein